jgi:hypothetical protein
MSLVVLPTRVATDVGVADCCCMAVWYAVAAALGVGGMGSGSGAPSKLCSAIFLLWTLS